MADSDFWTGGSLPTEAELRDYLLSKGEVGQAAEGVIEKYRKEILGTADTTSWSKSQVNDWVAQRLGNISPEQPNVPPTEITLSNEIVTQRQAQEEALEASNEALANQRSEVLARQAQTYYDQTSKVVDDGTAYGGTLATSIALGFRVDEYGNPLRDDMGNPIGVSPMDLWSEIRGTKFNMGTLAMPYDPAAARQRWYNMPSGGTTYRRGSEELLAGSERRRRVTDDGEQRYSGRRPSELIAGYESPELTSRRVLTPSQALAMLTSMDEDYLTRLQHEMYEAGLFERVAGEGAIPSWGKADVATRRAFIEMFTEASINPNEPISQLLERLADERIQRLEAPESGPGSAAQLPDFNPEVTSEATLGETIDEIARNLRGEFASPDEKTNLIKTLQDKEVAAQRELYNRSIADLQEKAGGGGGEEVDRFMAAIAGKESGGNYSALNPDSGAQGKFQIMPENWASWATRAGLSPSAPRTPGNQEIVARRIMLDYYRQFGNWRDVAVAWYSGPGRVASKRYDTRPQGGGKYPSISSYADDVMRRFGAQGAPQPGDPTYGDINAAIPRFDPAAEAAAILKAQDPAGWQAHEYGERAIEFFSLLGGAI